MLLMDAILVNINNPFNRRENWGSEKSVTYPQSHSWLELDPGSVTLAQAPTSLSQQSGQFPSIINWVLPGLWSYKYKGNRLYHIMQGPYTYHVGKENASKFFTLTTKHSLPWDGESSCSGLSPFWSWMKWNKQISSDWGQTTILIITCCLGLADDTKKTSHPSSPVCRIL